MRCFLNKAVFSLSISFFPVILWAYPSNPLPVSVDNGEHSLSIRRLGDEHHRYTQTLDGYLIVRGVDGLYYYADESGTSSGVKAKNTEDRSLQEKNFLQKLDREKIFRAHRNLHPDKLVRSAASRKGRAPWVPFAGEPLDLAKFPKLKLPSAEPFVNGTNRFPVILIAGSGSENADSIAYWNQLNLSGYNKNSHIGSVKDYFRDQSNGVFIPAFDIYLVSVSGALSSYKNNEDGLLKEAISNLKTKYVNFDAAVYDSDEDGEIDAAGFLYAGTEAEANGLGGYHYELQWTASGKQDAGNGKKFNNFFIICQMASSSELQPIATFVHEFSHGMGLKDHYCVYGDDCYLDYSDSVSQAPGAHGWDVMATGMYNKTNGATPPGYSAFEKEFMGWMSYTNLSPSAAVTVIPPLTSSNSAYKISVEGNNDEWFILENRQLSGWDASLPNHGMLIWHIDYEASIWNADALNDVPAHQRIDVVEAGNLKVTGYSNGFSFANLADDPFPGSQNVTHFSAFKSWAGVDLGVQLYSITENEGNVCFATQSGVSVGNCQKSSSSSSASSSSSQMGSSSSSSSADWTFSRFNYRVPLLKNAEYAVATADLSDVFEFLGVSENLQTLYESGELLYFGMESDGSLNGTSTATAPGNWFDASENICLWDSLGKVSRLFLEVDLTSKTAKIGHHPVGTFEKNDYTVRAALRYGNHQANLSFIVSLSDSASTSIAHMRSQENFIRIFDRKLELRTAFPGKKTVSLYNLSGKELLRKTFDLSRAVIDLESLPNGGVFVVKISQNGHRDILRQVIFER